MDIEPFRWDENDPHAKEHRQVSAVLADAKFGLLGTVDGNFQSLSKRRRGISTAEGDRLKRLTIALFLRANHLERCVRCVDDRTTGSLPPEVFEQWRDARRDLDRIRHLVALDIEWRKVGFERQHVLALLKWAETSDRVDWLERPLKATVRAVSKNGWDDEEICGLMDAVSKKCADCEYAEGRTVGRRIETLIVEQRKNRDAAKLQREEVASIRPANANGDEVARSKAKAHLLSAYAEAAREDVWKREDFLRLPSAHALFCAEVEVQVAAVLLTAEQALAEANREKDKFRTETGELKRELWFLNLHHNEGFPRAGMEISRKLLHRKLPFSDQDIGRILEDVGAMGGVTTSNVAMLEPLISFLEKRIRTNGKRPQFAKGMALLHEAVGKITNAPERKLCERLERLMEMKTDVQNGPRILLQNGEAWSDAAIGEIRSLDPELQRKWIDVLEHCFKAASAAPSAKWLNKARDLVLALGRKEFLERVLRWFPLVDKPRTEPKPQISEYSPDPNELIIDPHMDVLRGLAWCCGFYEDRDTARALGNLGRSGYRKVALIGPRAVRVGNAAVTALGMMPGMEGVYQLALLKVKVKFRPAQKTIEKAFTAAAEREGLPRDEIEELAVPSYGLTDVGVLEEKFDGFTARLAITGTTTTELAWVKPDGKIQKGAPASVKEKHAEELKDLKSTAKDIEKMLPAQRDRIDGMLLQQRTWPAALWRERYLDHPLVGTLARRVLWEFSEEGFETPRPPRPQSEDAKKESRTGIWFGGKLVDLDLRPIELREKATVRLWHPIGKNLDEVVAWRSWLEAQQIQQPFKQAHREIYLLTDAELRTGNYSNRYAAHVLKQHQFNALCAARGWKNQLRLMVDAEYAPPSLFLPQWGLRAEFWVEGIGDDYGTDTTESGAYLRLSTDQVRFYRMEAEQRTAHAGGGGYHPSARREDVEPVPLREIPELVFSEVMRDVDLFVGVASVGNDPTWADGGPDGRYAAYWQDYSFGALSGTAKTRKEVLQRLMPKLKIAPVCSFTEKFIVVKGKLRTYKIHLGSGNILMEPNDQYLCIVPKQSQKMDGGVMLPFEGDRTLSVILSKAFLLAADEKIRDESIVSQISRR